MLCTATLTRAPPNLHTWPVLLLGPSPAGPVLLLQGHQGSAAAHRPGRPTAAPKVAAPSPAGVPAVAVQGARASPNHCPLPGSPCHQPCYCCCYHHLGLAALAPAQHIAMDALHQHMLPVTHKTCVGLLSAHELAALSVIHQWNCVLCCCQLSVVTLSSYSMVSTQCA